MENQLLLIIGLACMAAIIFGVSASEDQSLSADGTIDQGSSDMPDGGAADQNVFSIDGLGGLLRNVTGSWHPPAKYAQAIANAEQANNLPQDLLARLLYQECRYREDIITGATRSPVGAMGIAQFMPATAADYGIDPLEPFQAIDAAARYLASLYRQTGTWTKALAAYNWGIGNVKRKGIANAPRETTNYYSQILADVNAGTGQTLA